MRLALSEEISRLVCMRLIGILGQDYYNELATASAYDSLRKFKKLLEGHLMMLQQDHIEDWLLG